MFCVMTQSSSPMWSSAAMARWAALGWAVRTVAYSSRPTAQYRRRPSSERMKLSYEKSSGS